MALRAGRGLKKKWSILCCVLADAAMCRYFHLEILHLLQTRSLGICFLSLFFKSISQLLSFKNDTTQFMGTLGKAVKLFYLTIDCILAFIRVYPEIVLIWVSILGWSLLFLEEYVLTGRDKEAMRKATFKQKYDLYAIKLSIIIR